MTIQVFAHQIRSLETAVFDVDKIAMIVGPHMSGKTSLLNTVGATLISDSAVYGATKKDDSGVRRKGAKLASCMVKDDDAGWSAAIRWPEMEPIAEGMVPPANEVTIGRVSPAEMTKPAWAKFVRSIAKAGQIKPKEVAAKLETCGLDPEAVQTIMSGLAVADGWDSQTKFAENKASQARGNWETLTGENFGSKKGEEWLHPDFVDIGNDKAEALAIEVKALVDELMKAEAVGQVLGGNLDDLKTEIREHRAAAESHSDLLKTVSLELERLQQEVVNYEEETPVSCPHCKMCCVIKDGQLHKADEKKLTQTSVERLELRKQLADCIEEQAKQKSELGKSRARLEAAETTLKKMQNAAEVSRDPDTLKAELEAKRKIVAAHETTYEADRLFKRWKVWSEVARYLGPAGARLDAVSSALGELQPRINDIAVDLFGNEAVTLYGDEKGVELHIENRPYKQIVWKGDPNSAALRIQIMFQILEAQRLAAGCPTDARAPIIIDRFDLLLKAQRNAVLMLLHKLGMPAILGQSGQDKTAKDLLAQAKAGRTYWINGHTLEAV